MEEKSVYSEVEVLEGTIKILNEIWIPMEYIEKIGLPIKQAIHNMGAILDAIAEASVKRAQEEAQKAKEEEAVHDVIELIPDGGQDA